MNSNEFMNLFDFTGRSVIVTGGTGILCREMARALACCGADIAIVARDPGKGKSVCESITGPGRVTVVPGDVLKRDSLEEASHIVVARYGRIDALINGAGGNNQEATTQPDRQFCDIPESALRAVIDLNLLGTIQPSQIFGRQMAAQGEGVILNVSSITASRPLTRVIGYSAAKAAIDNFTRWLAVHMAQEYSPRIRVNAIAPGFFLAEQNRRLLIDPETGKLTARGESIVNHTPLGRFGEPEDLLGTVLWLLSPASGFVTGVVVPVDGGFSAFSGV